MSDGRGPGGVFVHPMGICDSKQVGPGTRIWAFAHVLAGARVGSNCNICDHVFIEDDVIVGDDVTIKSCVQLWNGVRLGNRVFVGPNATFTNDRFPRSKQYPAIFLQTVVEDDASIGANATVLPGLTIGRSAMIGAGAVVTKNVPPFSVVVGNPATIVSYQTSETAQVSAPGTLPDSRVTLARTAGSRLDLGVSGCQLWRLRNFGDLRGSLVPLEFNSDLPFLPQRAFLVYGVPNRRVRGEHAHHACHQFLVAAHGALAVAVDDGKSRREVLLEEPSVGLLVPPLVWSIQYKYESRSVLLVMASRPYEAEDYIRDYDEFLRIACPAC